MLEEYPELNQHFSHKTIQLWMNKDLEEIYFWGDNISETPPVPWPEENGTNNEEESDLVQKDSDLSEDSYIGYVLEKLPYKKFLKLFKINEDDFEELDYLEWIDDMLTEGDIYKSSYDDFVDWIGTIPNFEGDEYDAILSELRKLNIKKRSEFEDS